jgi:hypothetical protein
MFLTGSSRLERMSKVGIELFFVVFLSFGYEARASPICSNST